VYSRLPEIVYCIADVMLLQILNTKCYPASSDSTKYVLHVQGDAIATRLPCWGCTLSP
jgi:hypothetical protein